MQRVAVFGGSGFVGSNIVKEAVKRNLQVVSFGRKIPAETRQLPGVEYRAVDVLSHENLHEELDGISGVVCTIGTPPLPFVDKGYQMRMNGDTHVRVIDAAEKAGVSRIVQTNASMPYWIAKGYLQGKQLAEKRAQTFNKNGHGALILKLPFVSGTRTDGPIPIPLWIAAAPLRFLFGIFPGPAFFGFIEAAIPSLFWNLFEPPVTTQEIADVTCDWLTSENVDRKFVVADPSKLYGYKSPPVVDFTDADLENEKNKKIQ